MDSVHVKNIILVLGVLVSVLFLSVEAYPSPMSLDVDCVREKTVAPKDLGKNYENIMNGFLSLAEIVKENESNPYAIDDTILEERLKIWQKAVLSAKETDENNLFYGKMFDIYIDLSSMRKSVFGFALQDYFLFSFRSFDFCGDVSRNLIFECIVNYGELSIYQKLGIFHSFESVMKTIILEVSDNIDAKSEALDVKKDILQQNVIDSYFDYCIGDTLTEFHEMFDITLEEAQSLKKQYEWAEKTSASWLVGLDLCKHIESSIELNNLSEKEFLSRVEKMLADSHWCIRLWGAKIFANVTPFKLLKNANIPQADSNPLVRRELKRIRERIDFHTSAVAAPVVPVPAVLPENPSG